MKIHLFDPVKVGEKHHRFCIAHEPRSADKPGCYVFLETGHISDIGEFVAHSGWRQQVAEPVLKDAISIEPFAVLERAIRAIEVTGEGHAEGAIKLRSLARGVHKSLKGAYTRQIKQEEMKAAEFQENWLLARVVFRALRDSNSEPKIVDKAA